MFGLALLTSPSEDKLWEKTVKLLVARSYLTLWPHGLKPSKLLCPWNSPGKNTEVGCHSLLQGIFPTQGSNPGLPHWKQILYQVSHKGSPRLLECIAYPFSSRFSQPRNPTGVSCIAGGFFINWAIREAPFRGDTANPKWQQQGG